MSELSIKLNWKRKEEELSPGKFSSEHEVSYNDHYMVKADTAPDWGGSAENTLLIATTISINECVRGFHSCVYGK